MNWKEKIDIINVLHFIYVTVEEHVLFLQKEFLLVPEVTMGIWEDYQEPIRNVKI